MLLPCINLCFTVSHACKEIIASHTCTHATWICELYFLLLTKIYIYYLCGNSLPANYDDVSLNIKVNRRSLAGCSSSDCGIGNLEIQPAHHHYPSATVRSLPPLLLQWSRWDWACPSTSSYYGWILLCRSAASNLTNERMMSFHVLAVVS